MRVLSAALVTILMTSGAVVAQPGATLGGSAGIEDAQGYITREWTWSSEGATTTFTAHGPAEQVNRLDPQDRTPDCPDCELASSIQFVPVEDVSAE